MLLFPAIDLIGGKAVRLYKGDYNSVTVYNDDPVSVARDFACSGMTHVHIVDLEGARNGGTPNIDTVLRIKAETGLFCEIGGGVRSMEVISSYLDAGLDRVILGTAAVTDEALLKAAIAAYGDKIAVGADFKDGFVAINGWEESTRLEALSFTRRMQDTGVSTVICTDVSKDGAMRGTNRELYRRLKAELSINITASGGVSTIDDVKALSALGLYGAIIGKAYYTGGIDLRQAREAAK
ncbi:MAG: 1-(5-phosphoribosyl)-5-[Clostridia bacterium]|nr:1-(5-phosphoribosyl)-5-[(5-phosphoribosylamino)methylideneamino]imidazole-4-carboxamide isomerase [Clostridia bacterium]